MATHQHRDAPDAVQYLEPCSLTRWRQHLATWHRSLLSHEFYERDNEARSVLLAEVTAIVWHALGSSLFDRTAISVIVI